MCILTLASAGERTCTELILQHQNQQQLSSMLWAAVRTRGCQFLGPAMQEAALKYILLSLEQGEVRINIALLLSNVSIKQLLFLGSVLSLVSMIFPYPII